MNDQFIYDEGNEDQTPADNAQNSGEEQFISYNTDWADEEGTDQKADGSGTGTDTAPAADNGKTEAPVKKEEAESVKAPGDRAAGGSASKGKTGKVFNSDEVAMFCDQFAMLLHGGISLNEGIYMLYSEMEDAKTKAVLGEVDELINHNIPFAEALSKTGAFPDYMVHMVEVGEKSGRLEDVMRSLSDYYERDSRIKSGIRSAVAYPMILFGVMACIMIVLVWKILPIFERMFDELNSDVSSATENVLTAGLTAGKVIAAVILILFALVILVLIYGKTKSGSKNLTKLAGSFGPTGKLMVLMATGKFISSLSLMMASGMDIGAALESEYANCDNETVKNRIGECNKLYKGGERLDEALRKSGLIAGMESRLVSVAAKTGETDVVLAKLSDQYNEKTTAALGKMTTIIETTLVIVLSVMVGAVLIAVMMPLVSMISSIG